MVTKTKQRVQAYIRTLEVENIKLLLKSTLQSILVHMVTGKALG